MNSLVRLVLPDVRELLREAKPEEISTALARLGVNVEELDTGCFDAAMSGQTMFRAAARLQLPEKVPVERLRQELEAVADDVMVDLTLGEPSGGREPDYGS